MKLAIYQGPPIGGDIEAGFARLETQLCAAAMAGAKMAVFPELFLPGYNRPDLHQSLAQPFKGEWTQRFFELARKTGCGLTLGWAERDGDQVYNSATAVDDAGALLGHYRKIQLFGAMERASFEAGNSYTVFQFAGRKTALLICYDIEFPQHCRALADQGVSLVLVPTANPSNFEHVSAIFVPARAAETGMTIAYANYCGAENNLSFAGKSVIAGPDAQALAAAGLGETLLVADLAVADAVAPGILSTQRNDFREVTT
ncbi:carbon-nitrogen hydrolase family protein [uncultured Roseibium sp.]|uniref:carbon-nitrogen hydrolase family protein n=1 Tax=uncultured Roseibium sp. TaxID=1936171 RepID=UPI0025913918|nr:carbon-nitrogen hydrolase family protein [uncultured Roseibium sp.]